MGHEVKKTGRQKLLQHKNASTLLQFIFCTSNWAKNLILFLKLSFDVFECEKNPWTYFLKILYVKNIYFEKISGFKAPFSAAAITAAGENFFNFFLHILID